MSGKISVESGILYVATGARSLSLAKISVEWLRKVEDNILVAIYTDADNADVAAKFADQVLVADEPEYNWNDKIRGLASSPFERTIYLDVDTLPIRPFVEDLGRGLDFYPLIARDGARFLFSWETDRYPPCLTQFNTGVMAYRREEAAALFESWMRLRQEMPDGHDQPTFRAAVLETRIPVGNLAPEYNFGPLNLSFQPVRIIHFLSDHKELMLDPTKRNKVVREIKKFEQGPNVFSVGFRMWWREQRFACIRIICHTLSDWRRWRRYLHPSIYLSKLNRIFLRRSDS